MDRPVLKENVNLWAHNCDLPSVSVHGTSLCCIYYSNSVKHVVFIILIFQTSKGFLSKQIQISFFVGDILPSL